MKRPSIRTALIAAAIVALGAFVLLRIGDYVLLTCLIALMSMTYGSGLCVDSFLNRSKVIQNEAAPRIIRQMTASQSYNVIRTHRA